MHPIHLFHIDGLRVLLLVTLVRQNSAVQTLDPWRAIATRAPVPEGGSCNGISSMSVTVSWTLPPPRHHPTQQQTDSETQADINASDMYMVGVYAPGDLAGKPSSVQTCTNTTTTISGLAPNRTYEFRVRAHPAALPARVWGWGNWSSAWQCRTVTARAGAPTRVWAQGPIAATSLSVSWAWESEHQQPRLDDTATVEVHWTWESFIDSRDVRTPNTSMSTTWGDGRQDDAALHGRQRARASAGQVRLDGLMAGSRYRVTVGGSDPILVHTSPPGVVYTEVYRVSEGTHEIDLLENHNSGDVMGEAAFLTDSSNFPVPWQIMATDPCAAALNATQCQPGGGTSCTKCVHNVWEVSASLREHCSDPEVPWPFDNNIVEAWCGTAFQFFDWEATPVTRYCVARRPGPETSQAYSTTGLSNHIPPGYAEYASCNAPEASVVHNSPTNPVCICTCYADRVIGMQAPSEVWPHCGPPQTLAGFRYPQCNCTSDSVRLPEDSPSFTWMGALPIFCPYFYYIIPQQTYSGRVTCGTWFSHPRKGSCLSPDPRSPRSLSNGACTWQRLDDATVVFGPDLLSAGWNRSLTYGDKTGQHLNTTMQTLHNAGALERAFAARLQRAGLSPRCCGC
eukprot:m.209471 g.209471  ORF g.209471 m.209471 type:complete len:623 (+) comp24609_c0_seq1:116-1984(+)